MGKTIAEKILGNHCGREVTAGEIVNCNVDFCFAQDGTSGIVIDRLSELKKHFISDKNKIALVIDHSAPSPNRGVSQIHKKMRDFTTAEGIHLYDIGCGVCHQVIPQSGKIVPGDLVVGADSHTCTYGALNILSTGMGSTDVAIVFATGKNWFKVPESVKIIVNGELPKGVYSKDVILNIIGQLGADGCTYKSMEFYGKVIENFSIDARLTITNMVVEAGAKCGLMEADQKVLNWIKKYSKYKANPVKADKDAIYSAVYEYNVSSLEPQVALPHSVDNVVNISEVEGEHIDEAFIGSCTNGRIEDLEIAVKILRGKKIAKDVRFIVAPASKEIYKEAIETGLIQSLIDSGAVIVAPGCGPCVGTHNGVPSNGENVISTANRNFKGRMGNPEAFINLASPATVAASALEGAITDPRQYL